MLYQILWKFFVSGSWSIEERLPKWRPVELLQRHPVHAEPVWSVRSKVFAEIWNRNVPFKNIVYIHSFLPKTRLNLSFKHSNVELVNKESLKGFADKAITVYLNVNRTLNIQFIVLFQEFVSFCFVWKHFVQELMNKKLSRYHNYLYLSYIISNNIIERNVDSIFRKIILTWHLAF